MRISDWSSDVCSSDLLVHRTEAESHGMLPVVAMHEIGGSDLTVRQSEVVLDRAPQPEQLIKANRCGHIILTQDAMADPFGAGNKTTEHRAADRKSTRLNSSH